MSWITDLADKAEHMLNKLDQNAATALQISSSNPLSTGLRKSSSSSALSLKTSFSPEKQARKHEKSHEVKLDLTSSSDNLLKQSEQDLHSLAIDVANPAAERCSIIDAQELAAFKIALGELRKERDALRQRLQSDTESTRLRQRLTDAQARQQQLQAELDQAQSELFEVKRQCDSEQQKTSELHMKIMRLQQDYQETSLKLQLQVKETEQHRQELEHYRAKAQLALQMKDNLIAELKSEEQRDGTSAAASDEMRVLQMEMASLQREHQQACEENQRLKLQLNESRAELEKLCQQQSATINSYRTNEEKLRLEMKIQQERTINLESEQRLLLQEQKTLRQQLSNQMSMANKLQRELEQRSNVSASVADSAELNGFETRIRTLTQTLVDKQSALERVTAERSALRIQLERAQQQIAEQGLQRNSRLLPTNTTDDVKAQFPLLMMETPFDNRVARRMKRAYSSLDSAGIRLGAFLRRYPLMRICVLVYVGMLHLWVMFVLLFSTPAT